MWLMLIFIFTSPIGIILMWKNNKYAPVIRVILTAFFGICFIAVIASKPDTVNNKPDTVAIESKSNESDKKPVNTTSQTEPSKPETQTSKPVEKVVSVLSSKLCKDYSNNEIKADGIYKNKVYDISGKITDISKVFGQTYIVLSDGNEFSATGVQCFFNSQEEGNISKLNKGQIVKIRGTINGKSMNIEVKDCKIVK
jgi:hypothetical protein